MNKILIAGVASLALWATSAEAVTFTYSGSVAAWTVPVGGNYRILATGAPGGFGVSGVPGVGAVIGGDVFLTSGTVLNVVVGGPGGSWGYLVPWAGGGGGASWVFEPGAATPLIVAGGGGGGSWDPGVGGNGQVTVSGQAGQGVGGGAGGAGGHGGAGAGVGGGGGGGGWLTSGGDGDPYVELTATGGAGPPTFAGGHDIGFDPECYACGGLDLVIGGFGGGGAGGWNGGGGGGGYSGGGGGAYDYSSGGGGGGGSFLADRLWNRVTLAGASGAGLVTITAVVPEPSTWALLIMGCGLVGWTLRRRRRAAGSSLAAL